MSPSGPSTQRSSSARPGRVSTAAVSGARRHQSFLAAEQRPPQQVERDRGRGRVSGQPQHDLVAAAAEVGGVHRLGADAACHLLHPEALERGAHQVVVARRDAAVGDHHVRPAVAGCAEQPRERGDGVLEVVADGHRGDDDRPGGHRLRGEAVAAGVVHLGGARRRPERDQLGPGGEDRDARAAGAEHVGQAHRAEGAHLVRSHAVTAAEQQLPRPDRLAAPAHIAPGRDGLRHRDRRPLHAHDLAACHRVGALGQGGPGRDRYRAPRAERDARRQPRRALAGHGQHPGGVGRPHGPAVHGRAGLRRQVAAGAHVLGQDATGGLGHRHGLRRHRRGEPVGEVQGLLHSDAVSSAHAGIVS